MLDLKCKAIVNKNEVLKTRHDELLIKFMKDLNTYLKSLSSDPSSKAQGSAFGSVEVKARNGGGQNFYLMVWLDLQRFKIKLSEFKYLSAGVPELYRNPMNKKEVLIGNAFLQIALVGDSDPSKIYESTGNIFIERGDKNIPISYDNFEYVHSEYHKKLEQATELKIHRQDLIWLYNYSNQELHNSRLKRESNVLFGKSGETGFFLQLFKKALNVKYPREFHGVYRYECIEQKVTNIDYTNEVSRLTKHFEAKYQEKQEFKSLSRKEVESEVFKKFNTQTLFDCILKKPIEISGAPGTGKTWLLLRLCQELKLLHYDPVLITYNNVLVQELKRLCEAMNYQFLTIWTVDKLLGEFVQSIGSTHDCYDEKKQDVLHQLTEMNDKDRNSYTEQTSNQILLIDEAQDLNLVDKGIILNFYAEDRIIVSIGKGQYVIANNEQYSKNDQKPFFKSNPHKEELYVNLRNKKNIVERLNQFSESLTGSKNWKLKPANFLPGGSVTLGGITDFTKRDLNQRIDAIREGRGVLSDLVILVPNRNSESFKIAQKLLGDFEYFDLTKQEEKKEDYFPLDKIRFMNFKSCRGIESWKTIIFGIDEIVDDIRKDVPEEIDANNEKSLQIINNWYKMMMTRAISELTILTKDAKRKNDYNDIASIF